VKHEPAANLVPLDDTKQALAALPVAMVLGEIERAALHVLHVGEQELTSEQSRMRRKTPLLSGFTLNTRVGTPASEILHSAEAIEPRLIVMCKHSSDERGKMKHIYAAKQAGVTLAISTDAHAVDSFGWVRFGIDQARRGWTTADDVINTRPLAELRNLLRRHQMA
jgi:histidinol phosphatase-like PHP family hydrolase